MRGKFSDLLEGSYRPDHEKYWPPTSDNVGILLRQIKLQLRSSSLSTALVFKAPQEARVHKEATQPWAALSKKHEPTRKPNSHGLHSYKEVTQPRAVLSTPITFPY